MVTPSPTLSKDGHAGLVVDVLRCGESALKCQFAAAYQLATLEVCPVMKI